jgi:hypothetical protein
VGYTEPQRHEDTKEEHNAEMRLFFWRRQS